MMTVSTVLGLVETLMSQADPSPSASRAPPTPRTRAVSLRRHRGGVASSWWRLAACLTVMITLGGLDGQLSY